MGEPVGRLLGRLENELRGVNEPSFEHLSLGLFILSRAVLAFESFLNVLILGFLGFPSHLQ